MEQLPSDSLDITSDRTKVLSNGIRSLIENHLRADTTGDSQCIHTSRNRLTQRQQHMLWVLDNIGVIGLAYCLVNIASIEDRNDIQVRKMQTKNASTYLSLVGKRKRPNARISSRNRQKTTGDDIITIVDSDESDEETPVQDVGTVQLQGHITWKTLLEDFDKGSESMSIYYLASMPLELIRAVIRGDLPFKMRDPDFRKTVGSHVRLKHSPGIYAVYVSIDNSTGDTGYGPSHDQLSKTSELMRQYCNVADSESLGLAKEIDRQCGRHSGHSLNYATERRYACGVSHDTFGPLVAWLDILDKYLSEWAADIRKERSVSCLQLPSEKSSPYIGLSKHVIKRAVDHSSHTASSVILGLFNATLEYLYPGVFGTLNSTYQILHTISMDHMGLSELIVTLLASGHWWDGGLNKSHAGVNTGPEAVTEDLSKKFAENTQLNFKSSDQDVNIGQSLALMADLEKHWLNLSFDQLPTQISLKHAMDVKSVESRRVWNDTEMIQTLFEQQDLELGFSDSILADGFPEN